jgi:hypothetical protein
VYNTLYAGTLCAGTISNGCSTIDTSNFNFKDSGVADSTAVRLFSASGNMYLQNGSGGFIYFRGCTGGVTACLTNAGVLQAISYMCATDFKLSSDCRLKTCIEPLTVSPINIEYKQFELISEPNRVRYGVIAQELQKTNPELVSADDNGNLGVSYTDLLIKEVAYLKCRVSELEKKII